jgi:3-oxoacyl-[acyl-carrier-protein] synthase II
MSSENNRSRTIVVTGLGIFSPCGIGPEAFLAALREKRSGVSHVTGFDASVVSGGVGGEVKDFNDETIKKVYLKDLRKSLKVMSRDIQMGTAAASQALADAGLKPGVIDPERMGVEYGSNLIFSQPVDLQNACWACADPKFHYEQWGETGFPKMEPLWMLKYLPNMPACHIAIYADARGPSNSLTLDEASANVVTTEAIRILRRGSADVMITGSTGTRLHPIRAMHARLWDALDIDQENPGRSCKPFDKNRKGQAIGEAAGCMILEEETHAQQRGARVYGRILGGGTSCVLSKDGQPDIRLAAVNAIRGALDDARLKPGDIGHINAHGLGSQEADATEALAIHDVFGDLGPKIPVVGIKGFTGNSGAGCGVIEIAASLLSAATGEAPPTLNYEHADPALRLNVTKDFTPVASKKFVKLNFTRAGQASALVIEAV